MYFRQSCRRIVNTIVCAVLPTKGLIKTVFSRVPFSVSVFAAVCIFSLCHQAHVQGLTLTWKPPVSGPEVAGYALHIRWEEADKHLKIDVGDVTEYRIDGLEEGKTFSFYVVAYNHYGLESDPSNTFRYRVPILTLVPQVRVSIFDQYGVLLAWPSEEGKSYVVVWKTDFTQSHWTRIGKVSTAIGPLTYWFHPVSTAASGFYSVMRLD
jgi:hypothetical protein